MCFLVHFSYKKEKHDHGLLASAKKDDTKGLKKRQRKYFQKKCKGVEGSTLGESYLFLNDSENSGVYV